MLWWKANLSHSPAKLAGLFCWCFCHTPTPTCSSMPLLALSSLQPSRPLNLPCSPLLGSQPVIRNAWSNWNMREMFSSAALISHFLFKSESHFFFRAFCHPELQIFPVRPQQVQPHSWINPGPMYKSFCKSFPGTFRYFQISRTLLICIKHTLNSAFLLYSLECRAFVCTGERTTKPLL